MENKEKLDIGQMTKELIGGWLLWGILFVFIYNVIVKLFINRIGSFVWQAFLVIIIQGIIVNLLWKFVTKNVFKKKTIAESDVPDVVRNLAIFTIIICLINGIYNYVNISKVVDEAANSNYRLKLMESVMSKVYSSEEMEKYTKSKNEQIESVKKEYQGYLVIIEIGLTVVYLFALPFQKNRMLRYIEYDQYQ